MRLKRLVSRALVLFPQQSSSRSAQSELNYKILANILLGQKLARISNSNFNNKDIMLKYSFGENDVRLWQPQTIFGLV